MKQKIDPKDIRKGDLIRFESGDTRYRTQAVEYKAVCDMDTQRHESGTHYLLKRPEPPFEPYWGMTIKHPTEKNSYAMYFPDEWEYREVTGEPWVYTVNGEYINSFESNEWAKRKLAEGWVVIEKPEGVK